MNNKPLIAITGASSGIGAATARVFSEAGYPVLLMARRLDMLEALGLPNSICAKVDVLDKVSLAAAIHNAEQTYGPVDCLINNAGIMMNGTAKDQATEQWDAMIDVNMKGLLYGIKAVLPAMVKRQGGTIINVGSIAGRKTFQAHSVYSGTKFAAHAISESIREEVASSNVRVITIAPGMVETELVSHTTQDDAREGWYDYAKKIGGALSPKDIADSMLYAYQAPQSVCIREIVICPTRQEP
ncbi:MAG: SDR family oxidoreductase [Verrucomicrobiota bacterium]